MHTECNNVHITYFTLNTTHGSPTLHTTYYIRVTYTAHNTLQTTYGSPTLQLTKTHTQYTECTGQWDIEALATSHNLHWTPTSVYCNCNHSQPSNYFKYHPSPPLNSKFSVILPGKATFPVPKMHGLFHLSSQALFLRLFIHRGLILS